MSSLFGYSLSGLSPLAAGGLALGGVVILVALYLLRERKRRILVAFVPLWQGAGGKSRIDRFGHRLRRWFSLLVQLVLLFLLILAAADPKPAATSEQARTVFVLVDQSASMDAKEPGGTRLAVARQRASEILTSLRPEDRAMVAAFARTPVALSGFSVDRRSLVSALDKIEPRQEGGDLARALVFATAALRGQPRPMLVVVSDGVFAETKVPPLDGVDLRFVPIGAPGDNVALLALSGKRRPSEPGVVEVTFVVQSFSKRVRKVMLEFRSGNEEPIHEAVALELASGERLVRTVDVLLREEEIEAHLLFPVGETDLLSSDDKAFAVVPKPASRRVLVAGAPNLYLDGALLSFGDDITARRVSATEAESLRTEWNDYDIVIFDGVAPNPAPTTGRYLYLDPSGAGSPFPGRGRVRDPVPTDFDRHHPLLAQVSLADLNIREAQRFGLVSGDERLVSSLGTPLVVARRREGLKIVALAFDLRRSDLPLRPSFPLLLANAFDWLSAPLERKAASHRTGTTVSVPMAADGTAVRLTDPQGRIFRVPFIGGTTHVALTAVGFFRLEIDGGGPSRHRQTLATNLSDSIESNTGRSALPALSSAPLPPFERAPKAAWDLGIVALIVAFVLSLTEWESHHRRWTV